VSISGDPDIVTGDGPAVRPAAVSSSRLDHHRDPWLRISPSDIVIFPLPGQRGHGRTAFLRRQPARIVDGRFEGGYTDLFELICPSCGDHPYLDYAEVPQRLRAVRGPRMLAAALAEYDKHLGPLPGPDGDNGPVSLGPDSGTDRHG
jgi:hypothetical protein